PGHPAIIAQHSQDQSYEDPDKEGRQDAAADKGHAHQ
ncbi:hypothetical protein E2320_012527, partial [Naja naja]